MIYNIEMNEEKIILKLVEINEDIKDLKNRMESMVTRDEFNAAMDRVFTSLNKLEQERVFTV